MGKGHTEQILPNVRATDSALHAFQDPTSTAKGKSRKSLMQPQELAQRLLPVEDYKCLAKFATSGTPTSCGEPWPDDVIEQAIATGPHVSALTDSGAALLWEDIQYQVDAGFVRILTEQELRDERSPELKVSRVAVVPQENRRDRIILNLSAEVQFPRTRRRPARTHPSVNASTLPAADQTAVKRLGQTGKALLLYAFETDPAWEINWIKMDLSDGFWRMIVEAGKEQNFVFEMPPHPTRKGRHFVVPSALQMGWTNSPPYFCTATDICRKLILRLLAFTLHSGINTPHPYDEYILPGETIPNGPIKPNLVTVAGQVFVDDFCFGIAGAPSRPHKSRDHLWLGRACVHGAHAVFPPPETIGHTNGKDSISLKKAKQGDLTPNPLKELLGVEYNGAPRHSRCIRLPAKKAAKYQAAIRLALDSPAHRVSLRTFRKILGKLIYASDVIPNMRYFFTPLYAELKGKAPTSFVGLGKKSVPREVLEFLHSLLGHAQLVPAHISELVSPDLPHTYGTVDASGMGFGGTILPATQYIRPTVWRLAMPPDLEQAVTDGTVTMVDCEFVAFLIHQCLAQQLAEQEWGWIAGMTSHTYSDNSPTVGIIRRGASRATSPTPANILKLLALRQRILRHGPQDLQHWPGEQNTMADFPSRSFKSPALASDQDFLTTFTNTFPLPLQLGSWRIVRPSNALSSVAFSLLRKIPGICNLQNGKSGATGLPSPPALANTLTSLTIRETPTTWNASTCSWPLLLPCGKAVSTAASPLPVRPSRERYASVDRCWHLGDLQTLADTHKATTS